MSVITLKQNEHGEAVLSVAIKPEAALAIKSRFEKEMIDWYTDGTVIFGKPEWWGGFSGCWSIYKGETVETAIRNWDKFGDELELDDLDVRLHAYVWIKSHLKPEEIAR